MEQTLELVVLPIEVQELANKVTTEKREEVNNVLNQIFAGTTEWKAQVDAIEVKGIEDVMSIKLADTARLNAKNARLDAEKVFDAKRDEVQSLMSSYQLEDKLWLKAKQTMQLLFKDIEDSAKYKADYVKRYEAEQKELKTLQRINRVQLLNPNLHRSEFESMSDDTFEIFVKGIEDQINARIEAEKKAEAERLEAIRIENERIEAQRIENERLKKEAEIKESELKRIEAIKAKRNNELRPFIVFIRDYNAMLNMSDADYKKEFEEVKKGAELQWEFERKEVIRKQQEEERQRAIIEKQRIENERIAKELKAKQDAEIQATKEREDLELKAKKESEKLAKAPIKKQLQVWVSSFDIGTVPDNETALLIAGKFQDFKAWANKQIESI